METLDVKAAKKAVRKKTAPTTVPISPMAISGVMCLAAPIQKKVQISHKSSRYLDLFLFFFYSSSLIPMRSNFSLEITTSKSSFFGTGNFTHIVRSDML